MKHLTKILKPVMSTFPSNIFLISGLLFLLVAISANIFFLNRTLGDKFACLTVGSNGCPIADTFFGYTLVYFYIMIFSYGFSILLLISTFISIKLLKKLTDSKPSASVKILSFLTSLIIVIVFLLFLLIVYELVLN